MGFGDDMWGDRARVENWDLKFGVIGCLYACGRKGSYLENLEFVCNDAVVVED
jgi:hypothetical protein